MIEACERIVEYSSGAPRSEIEKDRKTLDAVVRNLEVLGEAAKRVPAEIRAKAPEFPWRLIA
jgi:uncharacterized protein with HEPN domain